MEGTPRCIIKWKRQDAEQHTWNAFISMWVGGTHSYICLLVHRTDLEGYLSNWLYWLPAEKRTRQLGDKGRKETFL